MALWKNFASMGKGVRIETDIGSLRKSVGWPVELYAHTVNYRKNNESNTIYDGIFTKREEFSYESEIRIALQIMHHHNKDYFLVPIDPKVLVKKIVVGPQIRWAYADIVAAVKAANLSGDIVEQSSYSRN